MTNQAAESPELDETVILTLPDAPPGPVLDPSALDGMALALRTLLVEAAQHAYHHNPESCMIAFVHAYAHSWGIDDVAAEALSAAGRMALTGHRTGRPV